jgi:AmmeMemoRadiSam system protein A
VTDSARRRELLSIARQSIDRQLRGQPPLEIPERPHPEEASCGVFVTLHWKDELRGCMGTLVSDEDVARTVAKFALLAAFEDPRFPPLTLVEWSDCSIEISILSPPRLILEEHVEVGRHGLILEVGGRRGLLLPQVATEWNFGREEFLGALAQKAGLPEDGWKLPGAKLYGFEAEVFSEGEARGE